MIPLAYHFQEIESSKSKGSQNKNPIATISKSTKNSLDKLISEIQVYNHNKDFLSIQRSHEATVDPCPIDRSNLCTDASSVKTPQERDTKSKAINDWLAGKLESGLLISSLAAEKNFKAPAQIPLPPAGALDEDQSVLSSPVLTLLSSDSGFIEISQSSKKHVKQIQVYGPKQVTLILEGDQKVHVPPYFLKLPNFSGTKLSEYLGQTNISVSELSDGKYKMTATPRLRGGGCGSSKQVHTSDNISIHKAAKTNNIQLMKEILSKQGPDSASVDVLDKDGLTALYLACKEGNHEIVNLLIESGADVKFKTDDDFTCLHIAAYYGRLKVAEILISKNVDINAFTKKKSTPLQLACLHGRAVDEAVCELLVKNGADPQINRNLYKNYITRDLKNKLEMGVQEWKRASNLKLEDASKEAANSISARALKLANLKGNNDYEKIKSHLIKALELESNIIKELSPTNGEVELAKEAVAKEIASEIPRLDLNDEEEVKQELKAAILRGWGIGKNNLSDYKSKPESLLASSSSFKQDSFAQSAGKAVAKEVVKGVATKLILG
jgi:hypothetical protein